MPSASVDGDERVEQFYEQISLNEDSAPTQQLQIGSQCDRNDETYYVIDYIN